MFTAKSVTIEHFKSIDQLEIPFKTLGGKKCLMFVGLNEAGKSNILDAISGKNLRQDYLISDCMNKKYKNNQYIKARVIFDINEDLFKKKLKETFPNMPKSLLELIKPKSAYTGYEVEDGQKQIVGWIEIHNIEDLASYYASNDGQIILTKEFEDQEALRVLQTKSDVKSTAKSPTDKELEDDEDGDEEEEEVADEDDEVEESNENERGWEPLTFDKLEDIINGKIEPNIDIVKWAYSDTAIFDKGVNLEEYLKDTSISWPLRNMLGSFCKRENDSQNSLIKRILTDEEEKSEFETKFADFLNQEFRSIWKDHEVNIKPFFDGSILKIQIEDSDARHKYFSMRKRSDGFKRFMAIMISFSFLSHVQLLSGKIIVIDEPEVHLHPSGIRYLRDELLKISENNIVLLATHSPFMIDSSTIERHYIVEKKNGDTTISNITSATVADDEVLARAFGLNIFQEILPERSIIVEGDDDKLIIQALLKGTAALNYHVISADGASKVKQLSNILEKNRLTGIFDADNEGKNAKRAFGRKTAMRDAYTLSDIINGLPKDATIEDLYPVEYVNSFLNSTLDEKVSIARDIPVLDQLCQQSDKAKSDKEYRNKIKKMMAESLVKDHWPKDMKKEAERLYQLQTWLNNHLTQ